MRNILLSGILIFIFQSIFYHFTFKIYTYKIQKKDWSGLLSNNKEYLLPLAFLIVIFGFNYFVISNNSRPYDGFLFGIVLGSFFNGINYAVFDNWSAIGALLDTLFVGLNCGFVAFLISKM